MSSYGAEFLFVAGAHFLALASPGPDFALVLKQSLVHGRRVAIWTSIGIGMGILVHVAYCLLGIGLIIVGSPNGFTVMKWLGALYLAWLGWQCLRAQPTAIHERKEDGEAPAKEHSKRSAWLTGFLTNVLNPKASLFFLALFSAGISPNTPRLIQAGYGIWMTVLTGLWFICVSIVFTRPDIRARFLRLSHWIERLTGVVLLGFAVRLAMASAR